MREYRLWFTGVVLIMILTVTACGDHTATVYTVKKELERHGFQVNYTDDVEGLPEGATLLLDKKMLIHVRIQKTNDLAERLADNLKKGKSDWSEKEKKKYYVSTLVHENVVFWFTNQERQEDVVNKLEQIIGSLKV